MKKIIGFVCAMLAATAAHAQYYQPKPVSPLAVAPDFSPDAFPAGGNAWDMQINVGGKLGGLKFSGIASQCLNGVGTWNACGGFQALTFANPLAINMAKGSVNSVTLTGAMTLSCPTSMAAGGKYHIRLVQDGTGGRVVTWPACFHWQGAAPVLSTAANAMDIAELYSFDGTTAEVILDKGFQ